MTIGLAVRVQVKAEGTLQGVGFRPFVYHAASELGLGGWIKNRGDGVVIEAEGTADAIDRLVERLRTAGPPGARIDHISVLSIAPIGEEVFTIQPSCEEGAKQLPITSDLATCGDCVSELFDADNRRYHYPWLSCAHCGPRFSMVTGVPYDRVNTTMSRFHLCEACRVEYENPADRRFHAESIACSVCGPRVSLWGWDGAVLDVGDGALHKACDMMRSGAIVAVKGIGGFHFWVDATSEEAVRRLRNRKQRPHKPFAVMFPSMEAIRKCCAVSSHEAEWLRSPKAPIVILPRLDTASLAQGVAPENSTVGAMLPYAPLHHLLTKELGIPVVATSGNRSDEPIVMDEHAAVRQMKNIADAFLVHDRAIQRPMDDSVVRMAETGPIILRRARGLVPETIPLPQGLALDIEGPVLAVGGHLKNTVSLLEADRVLVSQHLGDLSTVETERAVRQAIDDLQWLVGITPGTVACDLHPDYRSTRLAEDLATGWDVPLVRIQHHHAHVASCMAERGVTGEVLGVVWDGGGYGTDGTIWGGEFLVATYQDCRRIAHVHQFRLPGGVQAVREPRRVALAVRYETFGTEKCHFGRLQESSRVVQENHLLAMLDHQIQSPITTSTGRLFDAVSSILGFCHVSTFEGQAAMMLEQAALSASALHRRDGELYPIQLKAQAEEGQPWIADWRPMIERIVHDIECGVDRSLVAYRFHCSLAELIGQVAELVGLKHVALTGGCFQNALLVDLATRRLESAGFAVLTHGQVPPNDGGLSLGQAVIAACRLGLRSSQ